MVLYLIPFAQSRSYELASIDHIEGLLNFRPFAQSRSYELASINLIEGLLNFRPFALSRSYELASINRIEGLPYCSGSSKSFSMVLTSRALSGAVVELK